jgi:electron-transferring-flavoprotein dehydrogenase
MASKLPPRLALSAIRHTSYRFTCASHVLTAHSIVAPLRSTPIRTIPRAYIQSRSFTQTRIRLESSDESFDPRQQERESDTVDVCIVGAGPAGLAAAIRLKQLANDAGNEDFRVLVLEKAGEVGDHIVSGNVLEPSALNELLPDWNDEANPNRFEHTTPALKDKMKFLTKNSAIPLPKPPQMNNHGNFIISLSQLVKWLGERAEEVGVEIYPGFAAAEVLYNNDGSVKGVATGDMGLSKAGKPKDNYERGMEFNARITMLGEGCHGSLSKQVIKKFDLRRDSQHQTYGLGIKEVWEVKPENFRKGEIVHSMGYPLPSDTYGGGWMYHFGDNLVSIGLVVGLDYPNPWLSPYGEFQKMKHHPMYASVLEGGKCISYAGRTLVEGGFQSIPKVAFPGGALIGDSAGFVNLPKIKGTHTAMRSGMLAAEAAYKAITESKEGSVFLYDYEDSLRNSTIWSELKQVRNMRPSFHTALGLYGGVIYSGLEAYIFRGKTPWTLKHGTPDHAAKKLADDCKKIEYPKPDGKISFDIMTSVNRSGTMHQEDEPVHLQVKDWDAHAKLAWPKYKGVENRFCPAGVYEYVEDETKELGVRFQINSQKYVPNPRNLLFAF